MKNESIWMVDNTTKEEKTFKWYDKLNIWMLGFTIILLTGGKILRHSGSDSDKLKKKLRYFNPIIKKDFWGNQYVEWVGRDKPLTDEELNKLL